MFRDIVCVKRELVVAGVNFCVGRFASGLQCTSPSLLAADITLLQSQLEAFFPLFFSFTSCRGAHRSAEHVGGLRRECV